MRTNAALGVLVTVATLGLSACGEARSNVKPASELSAAGAPLAQSVPATVPAHSAIHGDGGKPAAKTSAIKFTDARKQTREFIGYFRSIALTPEQERIKVEALSVLPAPCCSKYSLATCCCPCNMSKAVWGMAAWLITEKGQGVEEVRQAAVDWLAFINPNGFSGQACFNGGCKRPNAHDGCGGMDEAELL